jgi:HK97 family phage prohead protease
METKRVAFKIKTDSITEEGMFEGFASTFDTNPDSYGDVIEKGAFLETIKNGGRNKTGIPILWQHHSDEPIGKWVKLEETDEGLKVVGKLTLGVEKADEARLLMKDDVIKALSIGFTTKRVEFQEEEGEDTIRILKEIELWEISPVTFPAKITALITDVKSIEDSRTERDLEKALKSTGLSKKVAQAVVATSKKLFLRDSKIAKEEETIEPNIVIQKEAPVRDSYGELGAALKETNKKLKLQHLLSELSDLNLSLKETLN